MFLSSFSLYCPLPINLIFVLFHKPDWPACKMDSREIEAQIKGLLGLQLGGQATEPTAVPPGAYPRQKNR